MKKHDLIKEKLKENVTYKMLGNTFCFLPGDHKPSVTAGSSLLGKIQNKLKKWGWLYSAIVSLCKPVWVSKSMDQQLHKILQNYDKHTTVLNLGSGPSVLKGRFDIINVDLYTFHAVDMIADAEDFPFEDGTVDLILNQAMLEHVPNPEIVVKEMYRLLRNGGEAFCYLPFIVPYHAAPYDYYRWTLPGVKHLFRQFDNLEIEVGAGPTSGMLWVLQEWLAILLSFGSKRLHDAIFLVLLVLLFPIKILDILLIKHPYAKKIASGFYVSAKKEA